MTDENTTAAKRGPSRKFLAAAVVAGVAFVAAVVFGALWVVKTSSDDYERGSERAEVLKVAEEGVLIFTEIDHTKLDGYLESLKAISTADLYDAMTARWEEDSKNIKAGELKVTAEVADVGISKLDEAKGDAEVLVPVVVTRTAKDIPKQQAPLRIVATLKRAGDEWKIADVTEISAQQAGQQGGGE